MEHKEGGKDLPFRVIDKRAVKPEDLDKYAMQADSDDAFRAASSGGYKPPETKPPATAAAGATETGQLGRDYGPQAHDSASEKYWMGKSKAGAVAAGVVLVLGALILGGMQNRNYSAQNSRQHYTQPYVQPQQAQAQQTQPPQPQENPVPKALEDYQRRIAADYDEMMRSAPPALSEIPLPPEIQGTSYGPYARAYETDLNSDGVAEIFARMTYPDGLSFGVLYAWQDGQLRRVFDGEIALVSPESTSGFSNLFSKQSIRVNDANLEIDTKHIWDGRYVEKARLLDDRDIASASFILGAYLESDYLDVRRKGLAELASAVGDHNTLRIFAQRHIPSGYPIMSGSELNDFLIHQDRINGTNLARLYWDDPQGFENATLGNIYVRMLPFSKEGLFFAGASAAMKSVARDTGLDMESKMVQDIDRFEHGSGAVAAFRDKAGRPPTLQEWMDFKYRTNALTEDKLRQLPPDYALWRSTESPSGTTYSMEFDPLATRDEQRRAYQQYHAAVTRQENARRLDEYSQAGAAALGRGAGKAAGEIRSAFENLGKALSGKK